MKHSEYQVDKLASHPDVLADMRAGGPGRLLSVHLMPQNTCNQSCEFCSYRLPDNKNSEAFNEGAHLSLEDMYRLLDDLHEMEVQGIEVTGGGEPLAYPHTVELWDEMAEKGFATALVTNGTLMRDHAPLLTRNMKWARVSIDSSREGTYREMRKAPRGHFDRAWRAVRELRRCAPADPEFRLGVGFVLCNYNAGEVYDFVKMARDAGADNVRLSTTYSDKHEDFFGDHDAVARALDSADQAAADFDSEDFSVHNLMRIRWDEVLRPHQDYKRCPTKDLLCVVEGEGRVYTCCTFTGSLLGLYGKFTEHPGGFTGLWNEYEVWRAAFDASAYCKCSCLYEKRNMAMNALIDGEDTPDADHVHKEFI